MTPDAAGAHLRRLAEAAPERPGRIRLTRDGDTARIVLDNPASRNALTVRMMCDLLDVVDELAASPPVVWRLSAVGPAFCAGGHLAEVRGILADRAAGHAMAVALGTALDRLLDLPSVGIAAIDGPAVGGGAELATAADLRFVGRRGSVRFVHLHRGVIPGWGGAARLVRHVGRGRALAWLLSGAPVTPEEAVASGFAVGPVPERAEAAAEAFTQRLHDAGPEIVRALMVQVGASDPMERAAAFSSVWGGEAHRRALAGLPWGRRR